VTKTSGPIGTAEAPQAPAALDPLDELTLLAAIRRGDQAACERLVQLYSPRLMSVARRLLGNEEDARDALQDAFISAFRGIAAFNGQSRLSTWLHRIVINSALMKLRSRRRRPEQSIETLLPTFLETGQHSEHFVEWLATGEVAMHQGQVKRLVRESIDRLPEIYRTVLLLRDIEELDTQETAQLLGVTPVTVKVRLHRARQALRTLLDAHLRGDS